MAGTKNFNLNVTDPMGNSDSAPVSLVINPTPAIQTALPDWTQTFDYHNVQMSTGTTGTAPFTWSTSAGSLPPGLSMNAGGLIVGSPSTLGSFSFTIKVVDAAGASATRAYTIQINPVPTISLPTTLPTPWNAQTAYPGGNQGTVTAGTGTAPFTWTENLPQGLNIDPNTGLIFGTPTVAGSYPNASITVTDLAGASFTKTYSMVINPPLGVQAGTPPTGEQGIPYSYAVPVSGGTPPYVITATGLPAPLTITNGVISGTPAGPSSGQITVTVKDATNATTTKNYTLTIAAPVTFTGSLHAWTVGRDYAATSMSVSGGVGTRTFTATGLPANLVMSTAGTVTGTPNVTGTFNVTVKVTDSLGGTQTQILPLTINVAPTVSTGTPLPAGERTVPYGSVTLAVTAGTGTGPFTWQASGLAASGLTLNANTGVISGTPTAGGTFPVIVTALDAAGASGQKTLSLVIAQAPQGSPQTLPQWTVNKTGYAAQITPATGGSGSYTYTANTLPAGLAMSTSGAITGTPTTAGTTNFTVTITDSLGGTGTQAESITINAVPVITSTSPLPGGILNSAYNTTLTSTGGTPALTWSMTGTLPAGLALNTSTGAITGTPTANGTSTFTVTLTDSIGVASVAKTLSITVTATPPATVTSVAPNARGQGAQNQNIVITGTGFIAGAPLAAVFSNPGITVVSTTRNSATQLTAVINVSGTATPGAGTVSVTNGNGVPATGSPTFTVNAGPKITSLSPTSHARAFFGSYSVVITGTGFVTGANATTVDFVETAGTAPSFSTTVNSTTQITLTVSATLVTSTSNVVVTNPGDGGTSTYSPVGGAFKVT